MKNVISVVNLTKKYKDFTAVDDLSFSVKKGEILGLLGPNGSGKSTTINCILSLLNFEKGKITIFDKEMTPNAYDIKTSNAMQMAAQASWKAIFEQLNLSDSEFSEIVKNQRETITKLREENDSLKEQNRQINIIIKRKELEDKLAKEEGDAK